MKQYIDKDALVAEIKELEDEAKIYPSDFGCGRLSICKELMNFLDTLEVKEVDLEKEIDDYIGTMEVWEIQEAPLTSIENTAKHFFELGLKAQKGE